MKRLSELTQGLPVTVLHGDGDTALIGITDDSRKVEPGWLFVARQGTTDDGAKYLADARANGAAAAVQCDHKTLGELAERMNGCPSKKLGLIGVTGTNGKTTVVWMIRHLLNATGRKCGLLSTIEVDVGDTEPQSAALTTPGACEISAALARMVANGCTHAAMECSSHALDQDRCAALKFDVAVFTNLTGDHLDYHQTMEAYAAAKAKLFDLLGDDGLAVINADDPHHEAMLTPGTSTALFTVDDASDASYSARIRAQTADGTDVQLCGMTGRTDAHFPLIGRHNVCNLIAAVLASEQFGDALACSPRTHTIEQMPPVPGRLERVTDPDAPFTVLVDYAHTDDALRNVLEALRPLVPDGAALRVLFGAGGDRDATKRPRMAQVACELADHVVVTSDNPRTEDPEKIIDDIMAGVPGSPSRHVERITDRREAIAAIICAAQPGDIVLLAGKGHEDYQVIGTERRPFDDRQVAREILADR